MKPHALAHTRGFEWRGGEWGGGVGFNQEIHLQGVSSKQDWTPALLAASHNESPRQPMLESLNPLSIKLMLSQVLRVQRNLLNVFLFVYFKRSMWGKKNHKNCL